MKFYMAASFPRKEEAIAAAKVLVDAGHECTSRWFESENGYADETKLQGWSVMDMQDVYRADILVVLGGDDLSSGGRHTELGLALAWSMPIYLLGGKPKNVFEHHPAVINILLQDLPGAIRKLSPGKGL